MDVSKEMEGSAKENSSGEHNVNSNEEKGQVDQDKSKSAKGEVLPLLLEDATLERLPKHVENLLNHVDVESATQNDLLAILTYCLALEAGFVPNSAEDTKSLLPSFWGFSFHASNINVLAKLPDQYCEVKDTVYRFHLKLLEYSKTNCLLFCLRTGDFLCITLTPENSPGRSICLSTARYVLATKTKNIPGRFRNLKELSFLLREKIFSPTRNTLMEESHMLYPGLAGVPTEILVIVLKKLNLKDVQAVSKTCWKLRVPCTNYYYKSFLKNPTPTPSDLATPKEQSNMSIDVIY